MLEFGYFELIARDFELGFSVILLSRAISSLNLVIWNSLLLELISVSLGPKSTPFFSKLNKHHHAVIPRYHLGWSSITL